MASIPFYAVSISAKEKTVYEYLTDSSSLSDENITAHSGVSWDNNENAASFNGSSEAYIQINNAPFENVSKKSGFTVSVDVKRNSSNGNYARILDFSNGTTSNYFAINAGSDNSDAFVRYCIFSKLNGNEIRYYGSGSGDGTVIYNRANFLESQSAGQWHNIKVSVFKFGNIGRLYYYFDNTLYYIYNVANYDSYIESFANYTTYYIGKSIWNDPLLNGYMKNLKITVGTPDETRELFHYTFDNGKELGDEQSSSSFTIAQSWNDPAYQQFGDHIWLRDGWMYAHVPGMIRDERYNKNWKIDFSFSLTNSGIGANRLERMLGISSETVGEDFGGIKSFGVSSNGKVYFNTNDFNAPLGDTGVNLKDYFFGDGNENNPKPLKLTYAYHNGIISVLMNDEMKFSADVSANAEFFEGIKSLTIGGRNGVGNWLDIFDLSAYSYQKNEDESSYLAAKYLNDDITSNAVSGSPNLSVQGQGAEWVEKDGYSVAHMLGQNSTDGNVKNHFLYLSKNQLGSVLSSADEYTGITVSFMGKRNSDSWQRFFELTNANSGFGGDSDNNYFYFSTGGNINARTNGGEDSAVPNVSDLDNWHVWTITVVQGGIIVYRDGAKIGTTTTNRLSPSWFDRLVDDTMLLIGAASPNWDPGSDFWMRDFRLYNAALSQKQVTQLFASSSKEFLADKLSQAAANYENKIKTGNVYNNTKAAYEAYVKVNRLADAVRFGNKEVDGELINEAITNLNNATNNMSGFSRSFSVPSGSAEKWASHDAHGADVYIDELYHNVLWSGGVPIGAPGENDYSSATAIGNEVNTYGGTNKNSIRPVIYRESAVLVYTGKSGDDPRIPVMFRCRGWKGGSGTFKQRHRAVYIDSNAQGMYLNHNWRGTDGQLNLVYSWFYHGEKNVRYWNNGDIYYEVSSGGSGAKCFCYANIMNFDGSNQFASNQYSKIVNGITWGFIYSNNNDTSNASQTAREGEYPSNNQNDSTYQTSDRPIYVINYAAVLNQLSSAADFAKNNITNYKEGGLSSFFEKYDAATAFDPNSYGGGNWDSDQSGKVDACALGIKNVVEGLRNVAKTGDVYNNLRNEMGSSHNGFNSAMSDYFGTELETAYTTSSIAVFKEKYDNAASEMALLAENPYKSTVTSIYSALSNAHHSLSRKADFSTLLSAYEARINYSNSALMNLCTTASVEAFRDALVNNTKYSHYTQAQQNETPISEQNLIDEEIEFINTGSSQYLDYTKSLDPLNTAYEQADEVLMELDNQPAVYTWAELESLVEAIENSEKYLNATASEKREFGIKSNGAEIDSLTQTISDELASLSESTVDLSAYNALWENAQSVDSDAYDYPESTLQRDLNTYKKFVYGPSVTYTNLSGETANINVLKSGVTAATVDAAISILQSSFTNHTRMYEIKISQGKLSDINGITFTGGKYKEDKESGSYFATYGTKMNLTSDSDNAAWYMDFYSETASRDEQFQDIGKTYSTNVFGNINISVKTEEIGNKVTILRSYNDNERTPVQLVDYVSGSYTVPVAPALSYYNFAGYTFNGDPILAGDIINFDEDITIIANYTSDNTLPFAINVEEKDGTTASYNDKVLLGGNSNTYGWLEKIGNTNSYKPFYVGKDVEFFATESVTLRPVEKSEFDNYSLPWINVRQSGTYVINDNGKKKVTFNGQFVTDGSYEISEYGILMGKANSSGSISASDVKLENIGISSEYTLTRFKSTKDVGAHQFTIAVNGLSGDVIYKGYISYKNDQGITTTVYTDAIFETI